LKILLERMYIMTEQEINIEQSHEPVKPVSEKVDVRIFESQDWVNIRDWNKMQAKLCDRLEIEKAWHDTFAKMAIALEENCKQLRSKLEAETKRAEVAEKLKAFYVQQIKDYQKTVQKLAPRDEGLEESLRKEKE